MNALSPRTERLRRLDTLCQKWHNPLVAELDDLKVFERVAALRSFAAAATALSQPRSSVSRSVARLETKLGTRLVQRTTWEVTLTVAGESLLARCSGALGELTDALGYVSSLATAASGQLRVSSGIGFGVNVLSQQLPEFLTQYPEVRIELDLTSRMADLIADRVDVAVRFGELDNSSMVAVRLGEMNRVLIGSPEYLQRRGEPAILEDLVHHDIIEMPTADHRARPWKFFKNGRSSEILIEPRVAVNDALTIHRLVLNGAGLGIVSRYLCVHDIDEGRLVHLLQDWAVQPVTVSLIFPSRRELSPTVRAFVDYLKAASAPGDLWQKES